MHKKHCLLILRDSLDLVMELKEMQKQELVATSDKELKAVKTRKKQVLKTMQIIVNMLNQYIEQFS